MEQRINSGVKIHVLQIIEGGYNYRIFLRILLAARGSAVRLSRLTSHRANETRAQDGGWSLLESSSVCVPGTIFNH